MMAGMGHLQVAHVDYYLPDGRMLLSDASFRVGQGDVLALVGPNGAGKSTLLKIISGELKPEAGTVTTSGGLGVMPQFVGSGRDERTIRDLLVSVARPAIRDAAGAVDTAELAIMERDDEADQMAYAQALSDWADAGGGGRRGAGTPPRRCGTCARCPRSACPMRAPSGGAWRRFPAASRSGWCS